MPYKQDESGNPRALSQMSLGPCICGWRKKKSAIICYRAPFGNGIPRDAGLSSTACPALPLRLGQYRIKSGAKSEKVLFGNKEVGST